MEFYRSHDNKRLMKYQAWHIVNPDTGLAFCGDDPHGDGTGEHFESYESEEPSKDVSFCQNCVHAQNGYKVINVQRGQLRRYGPSEYRWRITDLVGTRTAEEVKAYCLEHIRKVPARGDPNFHPLSEHYQRFRSLGIGVFEFQTGYDWNG